MLLKSNRWFLSVPAAVIAGAPALALEPVPVRLGPVYISPTLDVETRYEDNLLRATRGEISTWVLDTLPRVEAWLQRGNNTYLVGYQLQDTRHASSHEDDATDHQVDLKIHQEFTARHTVNAYAIWLDGHEQRGTGLTEGNLANDIDTPVTFDRTRYGADYTYGTRESRGRIALAYDFENLDYTNFERVTRYRDRDQDALRGTFYWKVAPRTDLLAEARYFDNTYDRIGPFDVRGTRDSEEYNYFVGAEWEATARTSGSLRLGWYDRDYDSSRRQDDDGFSWEASLDYMPRSYSTLSLGTRRYSAESNNVGNSVDVEEFTGSWNHHWTDRASSTIEVRYGEDDYTEALREDERWRVEASYFYNLRRWLDVGAGYRYEDRSSNNPLLDYQGNTYYLEARLGL